MKTVDLVCPKCRTGGRTIAVGSREEGKKHEIVDVGFSMELACEECGYGVTIVDTLASPLQWVRNMFPFFPQGSGETVQVTDDEGTGNPMSFNYHSRHYEVAETTLSYIIPKSQTPEYRSIFYLVQVEGGDALLKREEGVPTSSGPQTVWTILSHDMEETLPRPDALPRLRPSAAHLARKYAIVCYGLLYEIETLLQRALERRFPDLENSLKTVTIAESGGSQRNLLKTLQDAKARECSQSLDPRDYPLLQYIDWWDLIELIRQKWNELFPSKKEARASLIQKLLDLRALRNRIAHMRGANGEDVEALRRARLELEKIFSEVRDVESKEGASS